MGVGAKIKTEMQKASISQNKLARLASMSQSGLSSIINEQVSPKEETLRLIADALGVPVSELLEETHDEKAVPERDSLKRQANVIFDSLSPAQQQEALRYLRFLSSSAAK